MPNGDGVQFVEDGLEIRRASSDRPRWRTFLRGYLADVVMLYRTYIHTSSLLIAEMAEAR